MNSHHALTWLLDAALDVCQFLIGLGGLAGALLGAASVFGVALWCGVRVIEWIAKLLRAHRELLAWVRWRRLFNQWYADTLPLMLTNAPRERLITTQVLEVLAMPP